MRVSGLADELAADTGKQSTVPEHIRALIVVLVVSSFVWWLARPAMTQIISPETFVRWRKFWFISTLAWFLSPSFWVYIGFMTLMLLIIGRRESHVFGIYLLLLTAAPPVSALMPGLGPLTSILVMDHYRMLALALLLPCAWRLSKRASTTNFFQSPVDWMVFAYLVLYSLLVFRSGSIGDLRSVLMLWIDLFLPYYVASRSLQKLEDFRYALAGLALGGILLSALASVEVLRSWKLYASAAVAMGLDQFGQFAVRGGLIRPAVTMINSIVLGYAITVAAGCYLYLQVKITSGFHRRLGWLALAFGVLASLSRGPWVGASLMIIVFMLSSPRPLKRLLQTSAISALALLVLSATPSGEKIINLLPFLGQAEQGNVEYRENVISLSIPVIERNLWFGAKNSSLDAPELQVLMQGEGIIDVVNSYVGAALYSGIVGLLLFVGMFLSALLSIRQAMRWARRINDSEGWLLGRSLLASVIGIMFIIFTASGIFAIPTIYFSVLGISSAFYLVHQNGSKKPGIEV